MDTPFVGWEDSAALLGLSILGLCLALWALIDCLTVANRRGSVTITVAAVATLVACVPFAKGGWQLNCITVTIWIGLGVGLLAIWKSIRR